MALDVPPENTAYAGLPRLVRLVGFTPAQESYLVAVLRDGGFSPVLERAGGLMPIPTLSFDSAAGGGLRIGVAGEPLDPLPIPIKASRLISALEGAWARRAEDLTIPIGVWIFRPAAMTLHQESNTMDVKLTEKESALLLYLWGQGRLRPVTRQDILDHVWAYAPDVETHTVETHIYRLRQKLEQNPAQPVYLITDDDGYRLAV